MLRRKNKMPDVPLMYQAQINDRCQVQRQGENGGQAYDWVEE